MCIAAAIVGGAVIGGIATSNAAGKAARAQTNAANASIQAQTDAQNRALALQAPQRAAGYSATAALMDMTGLSRSGSAIDMAQGSDGTWSSDVPKLSSFDKYNFTADPGYQFRFDQGNKALQNSLVARGDALSGAAAKSTLRYAQGFASQEYQNVYNRIAQIAGFGGSATSQGAQTIVNTGVNVGNAMQNAGDARASAYVAQGNAWANAANQIAYGYGSGMFGRGAYNPNASAGYGTPFQGGLA